MFGLGIAERTALCEIGVYYGWLFLVLMVLCRCEEERCIVIDCFEE